MCKLDDQNVVIAKKALKMCLIRAESGLSVNVKCRDRDFNQILTTPRLSYRIILTEMKLDELIWKQKNRKYNLMFHDMKM